MVVIPLSRGLDHILAMNCITAQRAVVEYIDRAIISEGDMVEWIDGPLKGSRASIRQATPHMFIDKDTPITVFVSVSGVVNGAIDKDITEMAGSTKFDLRMFERLAQRN